MATAATLSFVSPASAWRIALGGLGACLVAVLLRVAGLTVDTWPTPTLLWGGMLSCGFGLGMYAQGGRSHTLAFRAPLDAALLGFAGLVLAALALGGTYFWWVCLFSHPPTSPFPGTTAATLVWFSVVPAAAGAVAAILQRWNDWMRGTDPGDAYRVRLGILLAMMATAFAAAIFVFHDPDPENALSWDTMRLFFRNFGIVCLMAASLALLSDRPRRWAGSLLIVLHFSAICTATLAVPPSPNPINQIWMRVFRPYLEFMYLNNAYHFYSPEPGPPTHIWLRLIYDTGTKLKDSAGREQPELQATWLKLPDMDYAGNHVYPVSLVYQRILAITENAAANDTAPNLSTLSPQGVVFAPFYKRRLDHSPAGQGVLGQIRPDLVIPYHPDIPDAQQYTHPTLASRKLLQSYARYAALLPAPKEGWTFHSVKIYRVLHVIPTIKSIVDGHDAQDPLWYRPAYSGEYDANGNLLDPNEPFLFWVLPVLRDDRTRMTATTRNWAIKHSGDPNWIWDSARKQWTDAEPAADAANPR